MYHISSSTFYKETLIFTGDMKFILDNTNGFFNNDIYLNTPLSHLRKIRINLIFSFLKTVLNVYRKC